MTGEPPPRKTTPGEVLRLRVMIAGALILVLAVPLSRCSRHGSAPAGTPDDATYKVAAQALIRQHLRDPSSAEFSDVRVVDGHEGSATVVCGRVNARNGFGGMSGAERFVAGDTVALESEVGDASMAQLWRTLC